MTIKYHDLKLIDEAKSKLTAAFRKNAALRATKVELENKIDAINKRLEKNSDVADILADEAYRHLDVIRDDSFLTEIEKEVATNYRKSQRKRKTTDDSDEPSRTRMTDSQKEEWLINFFKARPGQSVLLTDIQQQLKSEGITSSVKQWLKPLKIPQAAMPAVQKGNRRAGTRFLPEKVSFLK